MALTDITLPVEEINLFCRKWNILELWLFGSALREDFKTESDIDFMARFDPGARMSLLDLIRAEHELADILHRPVDLVIKEDVERSENWIRRSEILNNARRIYAA